MAGVRTEIIPVVLQKELFFYQFNPAVGGGSVPPVSGSGLLGFGSRFEYTALGQHQMFHPSLEPD